MSQKITKDPSNGDVILARFSRPDGGEVRVSLREFKNSRFLDIRQHFVSEAGEVCPTRKGCTVRVDDLPALADAIAEARKLAVAQSPERG